MDFKKILKGIALAILMSIVFMLVLSVVVYFVNLSERTVATLVFITSCLSVFLGAFFLAKNVESKGLLNGLTLSAGYFLVLLLLSLAVNGEVSFSVSNFTRLLSYIASGALGGILGINAGK